MRKRHCVVIDLCFLLAGSMLGVRGGRRCSAFFCAFSPVMSTRVRIVCPQTRDINWLTMCYHDQYIQTKIPTTETVYHVYRSARRPGPNQQKHELRRACREVCAKQWHRLRFSVNSRVARMFYRRFFGRHGT